MPNSDVNLSTIIKRLEAVTSRLEDVASSQSSPAPTSSLRSPTSAAHENVAGHIAAPSQGQVDSSPSAGAEMNPATKAYQDEIIQGALHDVLSKSQQIGGLVEQHSALLKPLCEAQLAYLQLASQHSRPAASAIAPLLKPQADAIGAIIEAKDKLGRTKGGREWGACLSVVGEGVSAWGWVQVESTPAPFVAEMKNAAQFWADRVTKQSKETNPAVVAWAKSYLELIDTLQKYVKQNHTTGVTWNPKGSPAPSSMPTSSGSGSAAAPPPPPPASGLTSTSTSTSSGQRPGPGALLADLNRGGSVTSGLKKVDASQMTHKNPELRGTGTVPDRSSASGGKAGLDVKAKPAALAKKPARVDLEDGNKWIVENQEDNREIVIDQTELHQTVHIFSCKNSVIRISGKINAVSMVGCRKTSLLLSSAVSSLSITSSPSFEVQITGLVPTIQIDTTDSGSVYLSKECMDSVEIMTSKTSSINISVPSTKEGEDGEFKENPLPEQMKSRFVGGKVVSEIVEHAG